MVWKSDDSPSQRAPSEKPPFTVADLKKAIPPHCFQRSLVKSSAYLILDLSLVSLFLYCTKFFDHPIVPSSVSTILWVTYGIVQGFVATGLWVIAHECGHQAFSNYGIINDSIGMFLHTFLLVPYFSWKYSHRRHHSNTGNVERDEVFVPNTREEVSFHTEILQHPFGRIILIFTTLTMGWPLYLVINATGRKYNGWANHFLPGSPIFSEKERFYVILSDVGLFIMSYFLYALTSSYGFSWLFKVYVFPLLIVNAFLVLITFLQHTHPNLPHYKGEEWDWLRGALATVDRDYGFLNHVFHHIADTHVAHHLFSTMPHYHAQEATEAIKPILGKYYQFDPTPVPTALWRETKQCVYVSPDGKNNGVLWFHSLHEKE